MFKYTYWFNLFGDSMVKTLTIKDKVYEELTTIKGKEESFSDLFERLAKKEKKGIMEFAGFLSEETAEKMKKTLVKRKAENRKLEDEKRKRLEKLWSS